MTSSAMKACALRSGSSGNAIFVGSERTKLLIDAGICCRDVELALQAIGESASELNGLLITHEHSDHIAGVGPLLRKYKMPVYTSRETWTVMENLIGSVADSQVCMVKTGQPMTIGDLSVTSFETPHDAKDPVGYIIEGEAGSVAVLTDAGYLEEKAMQAISGSGAIFIEANYDHTMLLAGTYPEMLKKRILSHHGHLSNDDCANAACRLLLKGTSRFILSHISKDNNYPELALLTVNSKLNETGARKEDYQICVARRFTVSDPVYF